MGSFPQFAANNKLAAVGLRNKSAQIQSKPETPGVTLSGTVGPVERLTDLIEMLLGNPFPPVYDLNNGPFLKEGESDADRESFAVPNGVVQQVGDE